MSCKGLHCNGCGDGGGGAVALAVVVILIVIGVVAKPLEHAVRTAGHVLAVTLEVVVIGLAVLAAAAVAAVLGWAGVRLYRWRSARRALAAPAVIQAWAEVVSSEPQAIEAPKPHLDGVEDLLAPAISPHRDR